MTDVELDSRVTALEENSGSDSGNGKAKITHVSIFQSASQPNLSQTCLIECINGSPYYYLTKRYSHLLLYMDFTIHLCCIPLFIVL